MNPLDALKPIHQPAAVAAWPPGPGAWLALSLLLALIGLALWWWRRHRHKVAPSRQALAQLDALNPTDPELASQVVALIKRTALAYLPREQVADLHGAELHRFLNQCLGTTAPWNELLGNPYQAKPNHGGDALRQQARLVLQRLPKMGERHA
ncbi:DUF4381 domain-containing protein [Ferrimonas marina]|uniref:DUF4381 domain-containing protein n=1 Tax=Ferrimonas marina TaxID=299255 RepID=A0A1M5YAC6_9GAMM|nr:DUF4381 domain-containing protein [Ferrimonas marina]SHI08916.1 protein of unknown function [Ferrimonas marina]